MRKAGFRRLAQGTCAVTALAVISACGRHPFLSDRLAIEAMVFEASASGDRAGIGVLDAAARSAVQGADGREHAPPPPRRAVEVVIVGEDGLP
ncbi:MAG: hypothetical protein D6685_03375 [Bacteroidetes bacterium]|nr:MAG: hypothetical protein D6685_03375 [Bacteroidota bacterium]